MGWELEGKRVPRLGVNSGSFRGLSGYPSPAYLKGLQGFVSWVL